MENDYVTKTEFNDLADKFNRLVYELNSCELKRKVEFETFETLEEFEDIKEEPESSNQVEDFTL